MSRQSRTDRPYDIVLFGATSFAGALTAEYLAAHAPEGLRWAIAGRNAGKLERLRERLPADAKAAVERADVSDPASLRDLAGKARVLATTVGPYVTYGEELVAACADAGTDYLDLCGEPEFVDLMYVRYDARARETGARLVHAAGFDSIPHDLGALFTVKQLPEGVPITMTGMLRASGMISGGTFASALNAFSRAGQMKRALAERRKVEPRPHVEAGRRVRTVAKRPHRDPDTGQWLVPLPTIDPFVVKRSAIALDRYGPDFSYAHYAAVKRLPTVVGGVGAVGLLAAAAQVPPLRKQLLNRLPQGSGPSEEKRARSRFSMRFLAEGGGQTVRTEVAGGDPGYTETAKMLGEAALSLAFDDNPETAGQVTTAVAMGDRLTERLIAAGLRFRVM